MKGTSRTFFLRKVGANVLGHAEGAELLGAEDLESKEEMLGGNSTLNIASGGTYLGHLLVGDKELLVFRILKIVLLDISPELLDALGSGGLLLANNVGEVSRELHGLGQTGSFWHFE